MTETDAAGAVDEALKDEYRRHGFITLPQVAEESEVIWLREIYDRLSAEHATGGSGTAHDLAAETGEDTPPLLPQILEPEKYAPELNESAHFKRSRRLASSLLDAREDELDFFGHLILKPSRYGAPTAWHQDEAYMDPRWTRRGLSVWTTLDDATVESGCLYYVPGGHLGAVRTHRHVDGDERIRGLETLDVDTSAGVACPLPPGGTVVHDFRTPHYAGPNTSDQPRRAYVLVFMTPPVEVAEPEPRPWMTWE